jgi:hypothetical protein
MLYYNLTLKNSPKNLLLLKRPKKLLNLGENPLSWQPCQWANSRGLANENSAYPNLGAPMG